MRIREVMETLSNKVADCKGIDRDKMRFEYVPDEELLDLPIYGVFLSLIDDSLLLSETKDALVSSKHTAELLDKPFSAYALCSERVVKRLLRQDETVIELEGLLTEHIRGEIAKGYSLAEKDDE